MSLRLAPILLLSLVPLGPAAVGQERYRPMPSMSDAALDGLVDRLRAHPPMITRERLPKGFRLGQCLLEVDERKLIAGACAYTIAPRTDVATTAGDFEFHGSRQVYAGVDYPKPQVFPMEISTDYFVSVDHAVLDDGKTGPGWQAHWNGDKRATHAQLNLGAVTRKGACYVNARTKICLWKK